MAVDPGTRWQGISFRWYIVDSLKRRKVCRLGERHDFTVVRRDVDRYRVKLLCCAIPHAVTVSPVISSNRANRSINTNFRSPIGPFRCFRIRISASPRSGELGSYTSSR